MKFWQVDAFTSEMFKGNPAAVFILEKELPASLMQQIAQEMNLSETVYVLLGDKLTIRWFTPNAEVRLCGHASLAAAHILWQERVVQERSLEFQSLSGPLTVAKAGKEYVLDFPLQPARPKPEYLEIVKQLVQGIEFIGSNGEDCMVVVESEKLLREFVPNYALIASFEERGLLLTARDQSGKFSYSYRGFFPKLDVPEDPVTGSANTCLAPYWAERLGTPTLHARQLSKRGGVLTAEVRGERVLLKGEAITVFEGNLLLSIE